MLDAITTWSVRLWLQIVGVAVMAIAFAAGAVTWWLIAQFQASRDAMDQDKGE